LDTLSNAVEPEGHRTLAFWVGARRGPAERTLVSLAWKATPDAGASAIDRVGQVRLTVQAADGRTIFEGLAPRAGDADPAAGVIAFEAPAGPMTLHVVGENAGGSRVEARDLPFDVPDFSAT